MSGGLPPFKPPPSEYADLSGPGNGNDADKEPLPQAEPELPEDDTPSAVDATQHRRMRQRKNFEAEQEQQFWRNVLADQVGRRAMWKMLESFHTFETRFAATPAGFPCPEASWFQAGQQASGQGVYHMLMRMDFTQTHQMLLEHHPEFIPPPKPKRRKRDG